MVKVISILLIGLLLCSADGKCFQSDKDTQKLFDHLTQPLLDNTANKTELDFRVEWQAKLELLDTVVKNEDDGLVMAYFVAREDQEFGEWVISKGGYKWLAPRILCFSRKYRQTSKELFNCSTRRTIAEIGARPVETVIETPAPVIVAPRPRVVEEIEIEEVEIEEVEEPIIVPGKG